MELPDDDKQEDAAEYAVVKLFWQSARRVQPDFELSDDNLPPIVRICRLCAGMPLAVELAAVWVEMLSPQEIAAEIERSYDFLETQLRDMPERHRSMRAVFEYSWNLLTPDERAVISQLAVFRGGFTREAAQAVTNAGLRTLAALVNKSLLRRDADSGRYEFHELLRQYAEARLDPSALNAVRDEHAAYFADFLARHHDDLRREMFVTLPKMRADIENIRAAWRWMAQRGDFEHIGKALEAFGTLTEALGSFSETDELFSLLSESQIQSERDTVVYWRIRMWRIWATIILRGLYDEGRQTALAALEFFRANNLKREMSSALAALCYASMMQGEAADARRYGEQSVALAREIRDMPLYVRYMSNLGYAFYLEGSYEEAKRLHEEALTMFEGSPVDKAILCNNLGEIQHALRESEEAKRNFELARDLYQRMGNRASMAFVTNNLGSVAHSLGQFDEAKQRFEESLALYREVGGRRGMANCLRTLGELLSNLGEYEDAKRHLVDALAIYRAIGDRRGKSDALILLGQVLTTLGEYDAALDKMRESLKLRRALGNPHEVIDAVLNLAVTEVTAERLDNQDAYSTEIERFFAENPLTNPSFKFRYIAIQIQACVVRGQLEQAATLQAQFMEAIKEVPNPWLEAINYAANAFIQAELGNFSVAWDNARRALNMMQTVSARDGMNWVVVTIGRLLTQEGQVERGIELLALAQNHRFTSHGVRRSAIRYLDKLQAQVAPEVFAAAVERGKARDLFATIEELLAE